MIGDPSFQWLCPRLQGDPDRYGCWECPNCGRHKWHARPTLEGERDRLACWGCLHFEDEYDLIRRHYPGLSYPEGQDAKLAELRAEYQAETGCRQRQCSKPSGDGDVMKSRRLPSDPHEMDYVWGESSERELAELARGRVVPSLWARSRREGWSISDLKAYDAKSRAWWAEAERRHAAECKDPEHCNDLPCRIARGLPELMTPEEIRADLRERWDGHNKGPKP
jgi:hypothetical protein